MLGAISLSCPREGRLRVLGGSGPAPGPSQVPAAPPASHLSSAPGAPTGHPPPVPLVPSGHCPYHTPARIHLPVSESLGVLGPSPNSSPWRTPSRSAPPTEERCVFVPQLLAASPTAWHTRAAWRSPGCWLQGQGTRKPRLPGDSGGQAGVPEALSSVLGPQPPPGSASLPWPFGPVSVLLPDSANELIISHFPEMYTSRIITLT